MFYEYVELCFGQKCMALVGCCRPMLGNECYDCPCSIILAAAYAWNDYVQASRETLSRNMHLSSIASSIVLQKCCVSSYLPESSYLVYMPCLISVHCPLSSLSKIVMARLRSMLSGTFLTHERLPTDIAPNSEPCRVGIIVFLLQYPAKLYCFL